MPTRIIEATQAVPPGRLDFAFDGTHVTLYSIQRSEVLAEIEQRGVAVPTLDRSDHHQDWPIAYEWMADRVSAHTGVSHGTGAVFWAWAYTTRRSLVSSAVHSARWAREHDVSEVLLTLRVPASLVLVSCFAAWHSVLMALPVLTAQDEQLAIAAFERGEDFNGAIIDAFCERTGESWWSYEAATSDEREQCRASWDNCLRPAGVRPQGAHQHWQACLAEIRAEHVVDAVVLS